MGFNKADSKGFYSVPIPGTEQEGYTPVYRHPDFEELVGASHFAEVTTSWDLFQNGYKMNPEAPCVGKRRKHEDGTLGEYEFKTYKEFLQTAKVVGSALVHHNFVKEQNTFCDKVSKTCKLVGLFLPSCEEWLALEQACYGYDFTLVPIYNTLLPESILFILQNTKLDLLFCTEDNSDTIMNVLELAKEKLALKVMVLVDATKVPEKLANNKFNLRVMLWSEFVEKGEEEVLEPTPGAPDSLNIISFTSGTTGNPKGVMITHKNFVDTIVAELEGVCKPMGVGKEYFACHLSYLPMAHMLEKDFLNAVFYLGGKVGLFSGDVKQIMSDVQALNPTLFLSVPRMYQRIHDKIMAGVQNKGGMVRYLFNKGLNAKVARIRSRGVYTHKLYDKLMFDKVKGMFGDKLMWMFVGSSCLGAPVIDKVRAMVGKPLFWGYALTESCAGGFVQHIDDVNPLNLGGPSPCFQFRVRSVPELNYSVDSKPVRGELQMRGFNVSPGYFKMDELTKETLEGEWLNTGDIVELMENGSIKVIDRKKQIFKLAQGEYVAPEYVESAINSSMYVAQSYVMGNPEESYPLAVVVPDEEALDTWKRANGVTADTLKDLCKAPKLKEFLFEDVQKALTRSNIKGYQRVKDIHVHDELFSVENGGLTTTFKLKRNVLRNMFEDDINRMYATTKMSGSL